MATQQETTGQTYPVYVCDLCSNRQNLLGRCQRCSYPQLRELQVGAVEYCFIFGHDGGTMCVPGSAREEGTQFVPLVEDGLTIGGRDEIVYSYEYLFRCARCGHESRTRR